MEEETITPIIKDTKEQLAFITADPKSSIILKATAGSGKSSSLIKRIKFLIDSGVDPSRIICFSYTVTAVKTVKDRLQNDAVKVTTIHSFCLGMLRRIQKDKPIVGTFEFINWYKDKFKPDENSTQDIKDVFQESIDDMFSDMERIGSEITAHKLQNADGIQTNPPLYYFEYIQFQTETKSMDFSDMLIMVNELLKDNKWRKMFKDQYDYILIDEGQDCSTIHINILLALNAKYYTIIMDRNQSVFAYSGANADKIISMLKTRRLTCQEMTLSVNFRSDKLLVENSNKYSDLKAVSNSIYDGVVHKKLIDFEELIGVLNKNEEVAVLVRSNEVIKKLEKRMLLMKQPLHYFNYLTEKEIIALKSGKENSLTKKKISDLLTCFQSMDEIINFIEEHKSRKQFILTIHKSKGAEYDITVVVNSISPEILDFNNLGNIDKKIFKLTSFAPGDTDYEENKRLHYVGVSRARHMQLYMIYGV